MSLEKAINILDVFLTQKNNISLTDISKFTNLNLSTVHRITKLLVKSGFLRRSSTTKSYYLGPKIAAFGASYVRDDILLKTAIPLLEGLSKKITAPTNLIIRYNDDALILYRVEIENALTLYLKPGVRFPLYCTAAGKAILAVDKTDKIKEYLNRTNLHSVNKYTITNKIELSKDLAVAKEKGYSISDREFNENIRSIGAPIISSGNKAIGSISSEFIAFQNSLRSLEPFIKLVKETAKQISNKMSYL
jgi:IclR family KDG regulon transcriptional repressor